jgi:hypothetical protein
MSTFNRREQQEFFKLLDGTARNNKTGIPRLLSLIEQEGNPAIKDPLLEAAGRIYRLVPDDAINRFHQNAFSTLFENQQARTAAVNAALKKYADERKKAVSNTIPNRKNKFSVKGTVFELSDYFAKILQNGDTYGNGAVWDEPKPGLTFLLKRYDKEYRNLSAADRNFYAQLCGHTVEATPGTYYLDEFAKDAGKPVYGSFSIYGNAGYPEIHENEYCNLAEHITRLYRENQPFSANRYLAVNPKPFCEYVLPKQTPFNGALKTILYNNIAFDHTGTADHSRQYYEDHGYPILSEKDYFKTYTTFLNSQHTPLQAEILKNPDSGIHRKSMPEEAAMARTTHDPFVEQHLYNRLDKLKNGHLTENAFLHTLYDLGFKGNLELFKYDIVKNASTVTGPDKLREFLKNRYENGTVTKPSDRDVEKYAVNNGYDLASPGATVKPNPPKTKSRSR